jgi:hypothetical protein
MVARVNRCKYEVIYDGLILTVVNYYYLQQPKIDCHKLFLSNDVLILTIVDKSYSTMTNISPL